jgi:single-strand DNA-binding protein
MYQNRVEIAGNLTRDPEVHYTPKGTAIADLAVALNRPIPPAEEGGEWQQETTYVDVTVFGKAASRCGENLKKGAGVYIEGRLRLDEWVDQNSQQNRSKLVVIGDRVQRTDRVPKRSSGGNASAAAPDRRAPAPAGRPAGRRPQPQQPTLPDEASFDANGDPSDAPV